MKLGYIILIILFYNLNYIVSAQEITLYDIEVIYEKEWFLEDENDIEVKGLTINNTPADMDNVNITFLNSSFAEALVIRKEDSFYKIRVSLKNESVGKNVDFVIMAFDGPKAVTSTNHTVLVNKKPSTLLPNEYNKVIVALAKHIKENRLEWFAGIAVILIAIMVFHMISSHDK